MAMPISQRYLEIVIEKMADILGAFYLLLVSATLCGQEHQEEDFFRGKSCLLFKSTHRSTSTTTAHMEY